MEMSLQEKENEIIESFSLYDEWLDKYEYLIDLGKSLEGYPDDKKTEDRLIEGCQSRVWLDYTIKDGKIFFIADSDAIITKGIISLLISVYSGRTPEEIAGDDFSFVDKIGLKENLSPTRSNGLVSMINRIRTIASEMISSYSKEKSPMPSDNSKEVLSAEDVKELSPLILMLFLR